MHNIIIRQAGSDDAGSLAAFGAHAFRDAYTVGNDSRSLNAYIDFHFSKEQILALMADDQSLFLLAFCGTQLSGYATLRTGGQPAWVQGRQPIELQRLYVDKSFKRQGIGSVLLKACLDKSEKAGYDAIYLGVWEHNRAAQRFYLRWEFKKVGEKTFLLGDDLQRDWVFEKQLKA